MLLPTFEFYDPSSLAEACALKQRYRADARLLAGGTDLLVNMKKKVFQPGHLISLGRIAALQKINLTGETLEIGACVNVAELAEDKSVREILPALAAGARALGSPLVRNLATIGGNIGSARPAADLLPALFVYRARVAVASTEGERQVPVETLISGPGMTTLRPDELIAGIVLPRPAAGSGAGYINLGIRRAQDCNLVNVASYLALDDRGTRIREARIALGSVGPTPLRATFAEKLIEGEVPGGVLFEKAGRAAMEASQPILDFRGSAEYRRAMVGVLTKRTLNIAWRQARGCGDSR